MIIYREDAKKFKEIDRSKIADHSYVSVEEKLSLPSGNAFESMASSNPELFDRTKLKQLQVSKNLVEDFNKYFENILAIDSKREAEFNKNNPGQKGSIIYTGEFNTAYWMIIADDIRAFSTKFKVSEAEARKAVLEMYIPESLTEEGCRKLIEIRLKNNKLLTESLQKMLRMNYQIFNISEAEALSLIDDLDDDSKNNKAIGKIKEFLKDPSTLEKFKIKGTSNFDFRSIGGGVLFMSDDATIQFAKHPSKNLHLIFKHDAIVCGHGGYMKDISSGEGAFDSIKKTITGTNLSIVNLKKYLNVINNNSNMFSNGYGNAIEKLIDNCAKLSKEKSIERVNDRLQYILKMIGVIAQKYGRDLAIKSIDHGLQNGVQILTDVEKGCRTISNAVKRSYDPKTAKKNGSTSDWICQKIDTLNASNLTSTIDIIRQLKKEGFKNVFIGNCNPGSVDIPNDIRQDKNFTVAFGKHSVYLEEDIITSDIYDAICETETIINNMSNEYTDYYMNLSLNDLYKEYYIIENSVITEGVLDTLKMLAKKAWGIITAIWKKLVDLIKGAVNIIFTKVKDKFGENKKINKPIKTSMIATSGNKLQIVEITATSTDEISKHANNAISSIKQLVDSTSQKENKWMNNMNNYINRTFSNNSNKKVVDVKYKEVKESTIFNKIEFI